MKIIVIGDGKVGYTLTEQLSKEGHDIVVIDKNPQALRQSVDVLDVMGIQGNGASLDVLREAGAEVLGIASIFSYGMQRGLERLAAARVKNISLSDFDALCEVASEEGYIQKSDIERLLAFRANPSDESWMRKA